jgi:6-phosphogluconolactonase (cycloisomerase 2 family)
MRNDAADPSPGFVYMQTNEPERNQLLAFRRADDGALRSSGAYETGGAGDGVAHLTSQGSVLLTGDGRYVLVTNTASADLSVFAVGEDGPSLTGKVATGPAPRSVAEHDGLIYVLNTGDAPSLTGFRLRGRRVEPLTGSARHLAADADPAQVGFSPDGTTLVVTERGTNSILVYPVDPAGQLGEPRVQPSSGPTPYGFAFTPDGGLVVTEAFGAQPGKAAASSYVINDQGVAPVSRSVGNGRSEICWAVTTHDGRYVFSTNFADGAVSRYAIGPDNSLTLDDATAGLTHDGQTGLRDEDLSSDGRFLYAIDTDSARVLGWAVGGNGALAPIGSWDGPPATVAGLAAS